MRLPCPTWQAGAQSRRGAALQTSRTTPAGRTQGQEANHLVGRTCAGNIAAAGHSGTRVVPAHHH